MHTHEYTRFLTYVHTHMHVVHIHICTDTHSFTYICMDTQYHTRTSSYACSIFTCIHVHRHTPVHSHMYTYIHMDPYPFIQHTHTYTWIYTYLLTHTLMLTHTHTHTLCSLPHSCFPSALSSAPVRLPPRGLFQSYPGFPGQVVPLFRGPESCCTSWWNRAQWELGAHPQDKALSIQGQTTDWQVYTLMIRCRKCLRRNDVKTQCFY